MSMPGALPSCAETIDTPGREPAPPLPSASHRDRFPARGPLLSRACGETVQVVAWRDPLVDPRGYDPRSWYAEQFWLGVLGPTTLWLLRRVAAGLDMHPDGYALDLDDTARALGLGGRSGRHSPFIRAVERCVTFGMARQSTDHTLAVRRKMPPLARRHLARLPHALQEQHRNLLAAKATSGATGNEIGFEARRARARALASSLRGLGVDRSSVVAQLVRRSVHPALAHDAAAWAFAFAEASGGEPG